MAPDALACIVASVVPNPVDKRLAAVGVAKLPVELARERIEPRTERAALIDRELTVTHE
jgi:hypothetical protein